jgi:hypothetical protein
VALELLAQLAHEDVDRAIAVGHRVTPDLLVDLLALDHLAMRLGEQLKELELAAREADALAADECLVLIGTYLELRRDQRTDILAGRGALAPAHDRLDPRHDLLGMRGLPDPVVGAEAEPPDPLCDGRLRGADEHAQARDRAADPLEELPSLGTEHGHVDEQGIQLHRDEVLDRHAP